MVCSNHLYNPLENKHKHRQTTVQLEISCKVQSI